MAAPAPTVADLQALILTLQAQVANLQAAIPAAHAAGAAAAVTFADTPQTLNTNDLLDYSTKRGSSIYEQGCKALDNKALAGGFGMTTDQTVVFVVLKSLGIPTPRSPHYHILGPSLICLSPQVSLATKYLASREYSIEYHFHTVSLEEHQQSSTHNSRECL
jgi:hypothetical protein